MREDGIIRAAGQAVRAAQQAFPPNTPITDLLSAVTLAYGYTRALLERAGIPDADLDLAEEAGARLAIEVAKRADARAQAGIAQA